MQEVKTIELGQHHIQDHQIVRTYKHCGEASFTIIDMRHVIASGRQTLDDEFCNLGFVFNQQNFQTNHPLFLI